MFQNAIYAIILFYFKYNIIESKILDGVNTYNWNLSIWLLCNSVYRHIQCSFILNDLTLKV